MKHFNIILCMLLLPVVAMAQAKKPTLMVVPANAWCTQHGYMTVFESQGVQNEIPDYERALNENMELGQVTAKIGELMSNKNFPLKDLAQSIKSLKQEEAETAVLTSSQSGSIVAESPIDLLLKRAKADIVLEVAWSVNHIGPKSSVTYTLRGLDAYTNKQVAAASGTGEPSFSAEVPVLIQEAVNNHMDNFIKQLDSHFDDIQTNGREVNIGIRIFDNGSGLSFEEEYNGKELTEIIEDWMSEHTVNHRFNMVDATETMLNFEQVRIPLFRTNGMAMDTRRFVVELRNYLKDNYDITSKVVTKGLGRADLILGEK